MIYIYTGNEDYNSFWGSLMLCNISVGRSAELIVYRNYSFVV